MQPFQYYLLWGTWFDEEYGAVLVASHFGRQFCMQKYPPPPPCISYALPTAFTDLHPGIAAVGGAKGSMEPSVPGEIPAPASNAGRVYCRVGRGPAALVRRVQHVCAPPRSVFIYQNSGWVV